MIINLLIYYYNNNIDCRRQFFQLIVETLIYKCFPRTITNKHLNYCSMIFNEFEIRKLQMNSKARWITYRLISITLPNCCSDLGDQRIEHRSTLFQNVVSFYRVITLLLLFLNIGNVINKRYSEIIGNAYIKFKLFETFVYNI